MATSTETKIIIKTQLTMLAANSLCFNELITLEKIFPQSCFKVIFCFLYKDVFSSIFVTHPVKTIACFHKITSTKNYDSKLCYYDIQFNYYWILVLSFWRLKREIFCLTKVFKDIVINSCWKIHFHY